MPDPDPDEPNLGVLLFLPYRAMESRVMDELAAAGYDDVTLAQARVFQRIAPGGSRLTDLADQAQITKQSAGFLVDQLEAAGYVTRRPDPTDGRARLITISDRGARAVAGSLRTATAVEQEWRQHLGPVRLEELRALLLDLRKVTDPYAL